MLGMLGVMQPETGGKGYVHVCKKSSIVWVWVEQGESMEDSLSRGTAYANKTQSLETLYS